MPEIRIRPSAGPTRSRGEPRVRPPAVAGAFYPADEATLRAQVAELLAAGAAAAEAGAAAPKALIAPHAGYVYSGPVAGSAYARVAPWAGRIRRVVLLGPSHRVPLPGLALPESELFLTPLGAVPVDAEGAALAARLPQVRRLEQAHAFEHSLEVHLPFLQELLGPFALVPLVVGDAEPEAVAEVLEALWGGEETLIVVSSDLSHYLDYESARRLDALTARAIQELRPEAVGPHQACGRHPINGLLVAARRRGLVPELLDLRSSGDTAGPRDQVVGYGAWAFVPRGEGPEGRGEGPGEGHGGNDAGRRPS
ncbi:MAG: AmmeMemoRadiSam system protein B [Gammaproteobacteria bacterium]|nr:MAG: AmmeMemoRadiSam system protein B [Gammaproteobacteria bacterium]